MYVCALTERRLLVPCLRTFDLNCEYVLEQEQFLIIRKIFTAIWYFHLKEKCSCSQTIFINEDYVFTERTTLSWENATTKHWENFKKVLEAFLKKMSWRRTFKNFSVNFKTTLGNILNLQGTIGEQVLKQKVTQNYSLQIFVKFSLGI